MAHICIITPGQVGSNPRTVKEADALVAAGHDVTVIATRVMAEVEARDRSIMAKARWKLIRVAFDDARQRHIERVRQEIARLMFRLTGASRFAAIGHSAMTRRLTQAAVDLRADLYIAHYVAAIPAAVSAAAVHASPYAFDAEDFHPGDLPDNPRYSVERALIDNIERRALPGAAYVTAAAPGIAKAYAARYAIPLPQTVLNVFPLEQAPAGATAKGERATGAPSIYWFSQKVGPDRGLECAVRAIAQAHTAPTLFLRGMLSDTYRERLTTIASECGVAERLHFLPSANPEEMVRLAAAHDLGLVSETGHTENRRIALTNKQFTYLLGGVPALMSDIPAHREFAKSAKGAARLYASDNPQSLATAIDAWLSNPRELAAARACAFDLGQQHFNWEKEQANLTATVDVALRQAKKGSAS